MFDIKQARKKRDEIVNNYESLYPAMVKCLDDGFEDSFQYCSCEETKYSRLKSKKMLERVNEEIRR
ncbi:transposase-like protein [Breznakia pachnodae]|uniref:Transposase-like protein n=1 Tax=Breznakia pachnodae TaxID=265178 RepID=A0ABU0E4Q1_9FIRM|nr:transposase-like protein [Breznakia pachnodae]